MSYIKSDDEIQLIIQGGKILGEILEKISQMVKPGISTGSIDQEAERLIKQAGGRPAFKGYQGSRNDPPFPSTICASINEELVHGIASKKRILKDGDIFSIDIGMEWPYGANNLKLKTKNGFYTDTALTVPVGNISEEAKKLLEVTQESLEIGIEQCYIGNTVADIGRMVQDYVEPFKYSVIRDLVGHGVGHAVHEEPRVPNYYDRSLEKWDLEPGVVLAIEPMVAIGNYHVETAPDGWSIYMADKSLCAHFEHTIIITKDGPVVVTRRPSEIQKLRN